MHSSEPVTDSRSLVTGDPAPPGAARERLSPESVLVISLLLVSTFVVILNETVMGVALRTIMDSLHVSATTGQWLTTAFMLTMAIVIPISGFLMQRLSTRRVFLLAMTLFTAGTTICAIAPGFPMLLAGRIVQACGTAIMIPLLMTTVMTLVPANLRGRTMGLISVVIAVAPAIGPSVSGLILNWFSWRYIFVLVLPIAIASLVLGAIKMVNVTETVNTRIDLASVALSSLGFGGLIYGLAEFGSDGQGPIPAPIIVAVGACAVVGFGLRQWSLKDRALLDLRVFTHRQFSVATGLMFPLMLGMFGVLILLPIYLQDVVGFDPLRTGLLMLPGGALMGLAGPVVGRLYDAIGPRPLVVPGVVLVSASLWLASTFSAGTPWQLVLGMHVLLSVGLGFSFTPLFTNSMGALPAPLYSHGSAVIGTSQQVAGAAGTALFIVVMAAVAARTGGTEVAATAAGMRAAFFVGATLVTAAIGVALLLRPVPTDPTTDPTIGADTDSAALVAADAG